MKTNQIKYAVLMSLLTFSGFASAGTINNASITSLEIENVSSPTRSVFKLKVHALAGTSIDPSVCDVDDYFILDRESIIFDEIYSMLLTVKLSDQKVNLQISGVGPGSCVIDKIEFN